MQRQTHLQIMPPHDRRDPCTIFSHQDHLWPEQKAVRPPIGQLPCQSLKQPSGQAVIVYIRLHWDEFNLRGRGRPDMVESLSISVLWSVEEPRLGASWNLPAWAGRCGTDAVAGRSPLFLPIQGHSQEAPKITLVLGPVTLMDTQRHKGVVYKGCRRWQGGWIAK